jgi:feruloyl esterase
MTHGTADDFITPHNSIAYYKRPGLNSSASRASRSVVPCRFYVIPGFGHGFGVYSTRGFASEMKALEAWVDDQGPRRFRSHGDRCVIPEQTCTRPAVPNIPKWPKCITGAPGNGELGSRALPAVN